MVYTKILDFYSKSKMFSIFQRFYFKMNGKKSGSPAKEKNRRLDLFLEKLEIEKKKKEKIIGFVEELTTDVLKKKSQQGLRLKKQI